MVIAGRSDPNYAAALGTFGTPKGPVVHSSCTPEGTKFINQLNPAMQMVYAYCRTMLYVEFMAEMKRRSIL
ncbi:hypothetical protein LSUE1_G003377 [Lachnellula suecica]|uniref:Uncharacterized protein n=1 Tax=Lachnellula suecica TaxID=602035 RepID=A0A8T9CCH2_9HELO|nr:hypothetical protein LSUE1_G003377 [Lachnellula suecica]